jgi:hypothetical protein
VLLVINKYFEKCDLLWGEKEAEVAYREREKKLKKISQSIVALPEK